MTNGNENNRYRDKILGTFRGTRIVFIGSSLVL